jgi:amino acid efflux transporter
MEQGLTRRQAVPLAIGSIAGSGILFLPSAVYAEAGPNSLLVWLLATAACLPMLLMFDDMVRANPAGDGIEAFIRAGLGDLVARCVPIMFVALVVVGLPAGSLVAGRYVARALGAGEAVTVIAAAAVLVVAVAANLGGARASARVQHAGAWALVSTALVLLVATAVRRGSAAGSLAPDGTRLHVLLPGLVLAFWTFTGFENLTFLSREFRRPERDFLPVSAIALGAYGLLTALLTTAIAVRVPRARVDQVVGLLQLAQTMEPRRVLVSAVTVVAVATMTINATAWVFGMSRLVAATADSGPRRAILLLAALFAVSLGVLVAVPGILVDAVAAASAIFIVLYVLSIVSYVRVRGMTGRSLANLGLLVVLAASLLASGWRAVYGIVVLLAALAVRASRGRCA